MLQHPLFRAGGWTTASSIVENANKLVVERRRKGAGPQRAESQVNPLLALRHAWCSRRGEDFRQQIVAARLVQLRKPRGHCKT